MKKSKLFAGAVASATLSLTVVAALAHGGATGMVKERMDSMKAMGEAVKATSAMFKGETTYDADAVNAAAKTIKAHSGEALTKLFPKGSGHEPSEALPKIWTDWEQFEQLAKRLEILSDGLVLASSNAPGQAGSGAGTNMMGSNNMMMGGGNMMMGSGNMMGSGSMMTGGGMTPSPEMLASMPAEGVFNMVAQTCSSCHTKFRLEKK